MTAQDEHGRLKKAREYDRSPVTMFRGWLAGRLLILAHRINPRPSAEAMRWAEGEIELINSSRKRPDK